MEKGIDKNKRVYDNVVFLPCYQSFLINYFTAATGKSQRSVLGIADTNEKLRNSNLFASNRLESVRSPSNSISSALLINEIGDKLMIAFFLLDAPAFMS